MKAKYILVFYFLLLGIEIFSELLFLFYNNPVILFASKPLLMPTLILWAFLYAAENFIKPKSLLIIALIFSMFGDIALMFLPFYPSIFVIGLVCFLVTHLIYITLFLKIPLTQNKSILKSHPVLILPFVLYGVLLVWFLFQQNHQGFKQMHIPVIIYAVVILTMVLTALSRYRNLIKPSFYLIFIGSVLFVLSDTTIALSKFSHLLHKKEYIARIIIMSLYGTAQYLIVKGYMLYHKDSTIKLTTPKTPNTKQKLNT